jgi:hypothetical protein
MRTGRLQRLAIHLKQRSRQRCDGVKRRAPWHLRYCQRLGAGVWDDNPDLRERMKTVLIRGSGGNKQGSAVAAVENQSTRLSRDARHEYNRRRAMVLRQVVDSLFVHFAPRFHEVDRTCEHVALCPFGTIRS